jgi:hypothetical protein
MAAPVTQSVPGAPGQKYSRLPCDWRRIDPHSWPVFFFTSLLHEQHFQPEKKRPLVACFH